jgi:hypothetical protein
MLIMWLTGAMEAAAKQQSHLKVNMSATTIPLNGSATIVARLTDGGGNPLAGQKIIFAYDQGWNWAEYMETDADGKASYTLRTVNSILRTGFCDRNGSLKVPSRYQAQVYFQGSVDYEGSMARIDFQVVDAGEAASNPVEKMEYVERNFKRVEPVVYYGWDYDNRDPKDFNFGPFGSIYYLEWGRLNYGYIDDYLNKAQAMKIKLPDGREVSKPVILGVPFYEDGVDYTPSAVKSMVGGSYMLQPKHADGSACTPVPAPKYCDPTWQSEYKKMVYALGQRYDGKISGFLISFGYDGEAVDAKNFGDCDYKAELHNTYKCNSFFKVAGDAMRWHREAFPNTPLLIQAQVFTALGDQLNPPVGFKTNNWVAENGAWAYSNIGDQAGESRVWYTNPTLPRAFESKYGAGFVSGLADAANKNYWGTYWMILSMMAHRPDFIDFHSDHWDAFVTIPWLSEFVNAQMQKKVNNIPMVWTVLRDLQDDVKKDDPYWGCGMSGLYGDYSVYMYRRDNLNKNKSVPVKYTELPSKTYGQIYTNKTLKNLSRLDVESPAYTARRTDQASGNDYMSFDIDNGWRSAGLKPDGRRSYKIVLVYLDNGHDSLGVEYYDGNNQLKSYDIQKTGTSLWKRQVINLNDAYFNDQFTGKTDLRINNRQDGDETIHMIQVWDNGQTSGEPTPTSGQNPTPSQPATPTPSSGPNPSPSPRPSSNPNPSPGPSNSPSPVPSLRPTGVVPTVTLRPSGSRERVCPAVFGCYQYESEFRWLASGYENLGFKRVKDNECNSRGVPIPNYKDKLRGDANCDGYISGADYSIWRKEAIDKQQSNGAWEADFNQDGVVDESDLGILKTFYLQYLIDSGAGR